MRRNGNLNCDLRIPKENGMAKFEVPPGRVDISDFLLWQLADSAFPTGGFAHSSGLEAAWQNGEVRNRHELVSFAVASLSQLGRASLPFVMAAHAEPERLAEIDEICEAFTSNHVANRASRAQGKAFLTAIQRVFLERDLQVASTRNATAALKRPEGRAPYAHLTPVFGSCLHWLGVSVETTNQMFFFNHLRSVLAAAVRLNIVGPMEAQAIQHQLAAKAELVIKKCESLTLDDIAQTAPLIELWQGTQERLYSRLFQS